MPLDGMLPKKSMTFDMKLVLVRLLIACQNLILRVMRFLMFKSENLKEPDSILVLRVSRLGDFINSIPALVSLRSRFPKARITLLTTVSSHLQWEKVTGEYIKTGTPPPWVAFVYPSLVDAVEYFSLANRRETIKQLKNYISSANPDLTFIFPYSVEGLLGRAKKLAFLRLAGLRSRIYGIRVTSDARFMRQTQYQNGMFKHQVWGPVDALRECPLMPEIKEQDITFQFTIEPEAKAWAAKLWRDQGWAGSPVVALFPGGYWPHKRWLATEFAKLANTLSGEMDIQLVIIGANIDREVCDELAQSLQVPFLNLAGQTNLMQLAALMARCSLFVGNDSGPAHLAGAVDCPAVTLFSGIEYPGFWEPWNSRRYALRHKVPCEPCFSFMKCPEGTLACIKGIDSDRVLRACCQAIKPQRVPSKKNWPQLSKNTRKVF